MLNNTTTLENKIDGITPSVNCNLTNVYKQSKHSDPHTIINQKFLGDSLKDKLQTVRLLGVHAPYGNGKTTAIKNIILELPEGARVLFITPRKSLNAAIAGDFDNIAFYQDIKKEPNKKIKIDLISSMACTPQSLSALLELAKNNHYDLVIFDESEAIVSMLVSEAVKEKERTLLALQKVTAESEKIVFMDANFGADSKMLAHMLSGVENIATLTNEYRMWERINAEIISGGTFDQRKGAINTRIIQALSSGQRVAIATSSATYANDISIIIKDLYPDLVVKLATSETDNQELVSNPDSVTGIDVLIYSPSLSVGISFDVINHFQSVFGVFANEMGTPDPLDAMQSMCRVRHPSLNQWVIALDDGKEIYTKHGADLVPDEIASMLINVHAINSQYAIGAPTPLTDIQNQLVTLYATINANKRYRKNNFNRIFMQMLTEMNVTISIVDISELAVIDEIKDQIKENKEIEKENKIVALLDAEKITDETAKQLKTLRHFGAELLPEQILSLDRYNIETSFNVDFDNLNDAEKREILEKKDEGYISKAVKRAQLLAPASFDKEYVKARLFGIGNEKQSFKVDILSKHQNYLLLKKLNRYALPYLDGKEYSHKSLTSSSFYQWVLRNKRKINIASPNLIPKKFGTKPALLMNKLLDSIGYKHTSYREIDVKNGKKQHIFRVLVDANFENFYEDQKARGDNWLESTQKIINELQVVRETLTPQDIKKLQMPVVDVNFVKSQLLIIPQVQHAEIIREYKRQYNVMNPENQHGIDCPIFANKWLKLQAEKYSKKEAEIH